MRAIAALFGIALAGCAAAPVPATVEVAPPAPALSAEPAPPKPPKPASAPVFQVAPCCAALAQLANAGSFSDRPHYVAARTICQGMRDDPDPEYVKGQIKLFLAHVKPPAACR
jgi:hypothetical protein